MEEMEKLLSVWMQDQHENQVMLNLKLIQEKAKSLNENLKKKHCKKSGRASFNADHSWFHQFKARASFHNAKVTSKTGRADKAADWEFPEMLQEITDEGTLFTQAGF